MDLFRNFHIVEIDGGYCTVIKKSLFALSTNILNLFFSYSSMFFFSLYLSPKYCKLFVGGFFIEAGSNDAEDYSDSLHFELNRSWEVKNKICA
jgi:hypothetical protein